ncbi:glycogen synthase GlgA [Sediminibacillus massiliensis]|uniref:glycogen synthase GlgA n=1 Tax=Sediminibacillus massiliensis TaxID=1926277 RepID=UPI0009884267|nr:glycogen synthase GlgA [Sediminibacillus massiliensis]
MKKKVLFVASECTPFVKTGGLADVVGSLPQELNRTEQADVRVILPYYGEIPQVWREQMELITSIQVPIGWRNQEATIHKLSHQDVIYYFVGNDYYFSRRGVYGYYDDGERFIFFSRAVIEAISVLDFEPDILHAHDWQAGLAVAFAKIFEPVDNMKTIFTIHNIKYQGIVPIDAYDDLFNMSHEHIGGMEWNGLINCMKSGIFHADKITTVSPTYAEEIKMPYYGEGLHQILVDRQEDLTGVINGIDVQEYNPMRDPHLISNYKYSRVKKKENKAALQEKFGLPVDPEKPMYVLITRLVEQKGLHLLEAIIDEFLLEDVQCLILGTGDQEFEHYFHHAAERNPDKLAFYRGFDEGLARQMYAGADFFIMPSKFEPCGLSQLIALQYKTVPIVRETGGLKDTVTAYNEVSGTGNGFSFSNYNAHDLLAVLRYSLHIYYQPEQWNKLLKNVNKSHFSWKDSALEYADLYESMVESVYKINTSYANREA